MKAIWYSKCGDACDVLEAGEIETPKAGPGQVRVQMMTSGVNPVDVKRRAGGRGELGAPRIVPHFDGAGIIDSVGDGVSSDRAGERVWVYEAQWQQAFGTAAEYVVVPATRAVPLPDKVSFPEGACLGIPALTAHRGVYGDGDIKDQTILVTGGAGAVGNYAVQFAKFGGATVIATVSNKDKADIASTAGADHVVNYRDENVAGRIGEITSGNGVDRVVDVEFGGNLETSLAVLKANGVIATYASGAEPEPVVPFYSFLYKNLSIRFELVFLMPEEAKIRAVEDITSWLNDDRVRHQVGKTFPLQDTIAAHEAVEQGAQGKVLIDIAG